MEPTEEAGKTVEEATQRALERLGIKREEAKVEIIEEGSKGLFGLGSRPARVRVSPEEETASVEATRIAEEILNLMGVVGQVEAHEERGRIHLEIKGDGTGLLIGRWGTTLDAIQFLIGLILSRKRGRRYRVVVDTEGYRSRRSQALAGLAQRTAEEVKLTGEELTLGPMNPYERHIVHAALQHNRDVKTISVGEEDERQVVIAPRAKEGSDAR